MGDKDGNKLAYSSDGVNFHELSEIPKFATGGMIDDGNVGLWGENLDYSEMIGTFNVKRGKNYRKLCRQMQSILYGTNNHRKRHGLPMRRKVR